MWPAQEQELRDVFVRGILSTQNGFKLTRPVKENNPAALKRALIFESVMSQNCHETKVELQGLLLLPVGIQAAI